MNKIIKQQPREKGAALLLFVILFLATSLTAVLSIGRGAYDDMVRYRTLESGKKSFSGAEAGIEDAVYRHRKGKNYSSTEAFSFSNIDIATARTTVLDTYEIVSEGDMNNAVRRSKVILAIGDGASFNFGLQSGNGGISMLNTSSVVGNVYSNGTVSGSGNSIFGDVISAGSSGLITSIHATGSAWSHGINSSTIDKDAYYYATGTKVATIVGGISYPGTPDQATSSLPISDEKIEEWKTIIQDTGTLIASTSPECSSGAYTIDTSMTLNNVRIQCNVIMKKQGASTVITIAGPVWIEGDLDFNSGPTIVASSSLGSKSVQIIVDNESNRLTSSKVRVNNATNFTSGSPQSFVVVISMNRSAEDGGTEKAIDLGQTTSGKVLVYASHGLIEIGQSTSLKEVTAHQIKLVNSAKVIYESGLVNLLFTSGPGGGFTVSSWKEVE